MELAKLFRTYLIGSEKVSDVTAKNYVSDLNRFFRWFESTYGKYFDPLDFSSEVIEEFGKSSSAGSIRSLERYMSALKKFAGFLVSKNAISFNPFDEIKWQQNVSSRLDPWRIKSFKNYLYVGGASRRTIKNYIVDINAFTSWVQSSFPSQGTFNILNSALISKYKDAILNDGLSPATVNRKLSSLRRFLEFAKSEALIEPGEKKEFNANITPISNESTREQEGISADLTLDEIGVVRNEPIRKTYSSFPPLRLAEKTLTPYIFLEDKIAERIAEQIRMKRLESKTGANVLNQADVNTIRNIPRNGQKETAPTPWHKRAAYKIATSRPAWYRKYHNYPISNYLHLSVLVVYSAVIGFMLYSNLFGPIQKTEAQGARNAKTLSFKGRITDKDGVPVSSPSRVRFLIYNDLSATGSGHLLWQESDLIKPDQNGNFLVLLGAGGDCEGQPLTPQDSSCRLDGSIFSESDRLYLGMSVGDSEELAPRQAITQVGYADNSQNLQGMMPITDPDAGQSNVILALDSSGNLTVGGNSSPVFSATGGQLTISGQSLLLVSNPGTGGDVALAPDGFGRIDIQKPIYNSTSGGNFAPGSVEIQDRFAVIATDSAQAALIVNNNTVGGDIFTASSSGTTRFTVENNGDIKLQPGVSFDTISVGTMSIGRQNVTNITLGSVGTGITLPGFSAQNGVLFGEYGTGQVLEATTGFSNLCLVSGPKNPSWQTCPTTTTQDSRFMEQAGLIFPSNVRDDFALGGSSTSSAKFGIFGVKDSGPVTATLSGNLYVLPVNGAGGKVGIGTDKPQTSLEVKNPGANTSVLRLSDADGTCDHNPGAGSENVSCSSDERLKSNISDASDVLPELSNYRIRTYTVNASGDLMTGVIAQEVQKDFPQKVHTGPDGFLMVDLPSPWVIVKAIQELSLKIENISSNISKGIASNQQLTDIKAEILSAIGRQEIVSPLASSEKIHTDVISPLADDSKISVDLRNSRFQIRNSKDASSSAVVTTIDNQGNASFSGHLVASSIQSTSDATVSGTLYAGKIKASSIEGLREEIAHAQQSSLVASSGAEVNPNDLISSDLNFSMAKYADLESMSADFGNFRQGLTVLGPATFGQVSILDSFSIGSNFIFGQNSIDTLGQDLQIQPLKQGAVSFMAGAVRIETDGSLHVLGSAEIAGDLSVGGKIKTRVLSPIPGDSSETIDVQGSIAASGSGTFNKLNLSFVEPAFALSDTEVASTASAGLAGIKPYRTELTIYNPNVTDKSLIYVTPVGGTKNQVLYLMRQVPGRSFTVGVDVPVSSEIQFNWIIVN